MDLVVECYKITASFPSSEQYGLVSQMRRAAASVPANIAEGRSRVGKKDYARFISVAQGSLSELETYFVLSERLKYLDGNVSSKMLEQMAEIGRMLHGLRRYLDN